MLRIVARTVGIFLLTVHLGASVQAAPLTAPPYETITSIKVVGGSRNSLMIVNGELWSVGNNNYGQLGDGRWVNPGKPVKVKGMTDVVSAAIGDTHCLAVKADGTVWGWGRTRAVGLQSPNFFTVEPQRHALADVAMVAIDGWRDQSMILKRDGTVWGWGPGFALELGLPGVDETEPVQVPGVSDAVAIAMSSDVKVALKSDGTVLAWGSLRFGDGTTQSIETPRQVNGFSAIRQIAVSDGLILGVNADDEVYILAWHEALRTGTATLGLDDTAQKVNGLMPVKEVAAASGCALALGKDGKVVGWGANYFGQLGFPESIYNIYGPTLVNGLSGITSLSGGYTHIIAAKSDGTVYGWGYNGEALLGHTPASYGNDVLRIREISPTTQVAMGNEFACALGTDGLVRCWGDNAQKQLGDPAAESGQGVVLVPGIKDVKEIATYGTYVLALKNDGTVWGWGKQDSRDIPYLDTYAPIPISGLAEIGQLARSTGLSQSFNCALKRNGTVWCWGDNTYGQLGDGTLVSRSEAGQVSDLTGVAQVITVGGTAFALKNDGTLWAWGIQSLDGFASLFPPFSDGMPVKKPVRLTVPNALKSIAPGYYNFLALTVDGNVWSVGSRSDHTFAPKMVEGLSGVDRIMTGGLSNFARTGDGSWYAWGDDTGHVLGPQEIPSPGFMNHSFPARVLIPKEIKEIAINGNTAICTLEDKSAIGWGDNYSGKLGLVTPRTIDSAPTKMLHGGFKNTPPEGEANAVLEIAPQTPYRGKLPVTDGDGDPLTITVTGLPGGATLNGDTGELTWASPKRGTYPLEVSISDGMAETTVPMTLQVGTSAGGDSSGGGCFLDSLGR